MREYLISFQNHIFTKNNIKRKEKKRNLNIKYLSENSKKNIVVRYLILKYSYRYLCV